MKGICGPSFCEKTRGTRVDLGLPQEAWDHGAGSTSGLGGPCMSQSTPGHGAPCGD